MGDMSKYLRNAKLCRWGPGQNSSMIMAATCLNTLRNAKMTIELSSPNLAGKVQRHKKSGPWPKQPQNFFYELRQRSKPSTKQVYKRKNSRRGTIIPQNESTPGVTQSTVTALGKAVLILIQKNYQMVNPLRRLRVVFVTNSRRIVQARRARRAKRTQPNETKKYLY